MTGAVRRRPRGEEESRYILLLLLLLIKTDELIRRRQRDMTGAGGARSVSHAALSCRTGHAAAFVVYTRITHCISTAAAAAATSIIEKSYFLHATGNHHRRRRRTVKRIILKCEYYIVGRTACLEIFKKKKNSGTPHTPYLLFSARSQHRGNRKSEF